MGRGRRIIPLPWLALAGILLAGCGDDNDSTSGASQTTAPAAPTTRAPGAAADMVGPDGRSMGRVTFAEVGGRTVVEGKLTDLPAGFHGFHVHAVGKCEPGPPAFTSAGGHMVLGDQSHPVHAGDQPVVLVLTDRSTEIRFVTDRYKIADLLTPEGRAMIVHALPDNYGNVPSRYTPEVDAMTKATGDAGDRLACGVVRRT
ncbi:superoxide dismutase family protein [uncultured Arthrobacter sp.]|uniref:superoxide dismutase family protein n=1 Tax=uncultured Arthrobacter sp. TaxID=114050 RepID=UPI003216251E